MSDEDLDLFSGRFVAEVRKEDFKKGMTKLKQRGKAAKVLLLPLLRRKLKSVISNGNSRETYMIIFGAAAGHSNCCTKTAYARRKESSLEVNPEDSLGRVSQVDCGHSKALSRSSFSSSSSKRRRDAKIRASIASLQAKQLAENELRETVKYVNRNFKKKWLKENWNGNLNVEKENSTYYVGNEKISVLSAQNQAEVAHLEHEILGQEFNEGKASNDEIFKVSKSSPSLKHYVVPSPKATSEVERKDSPSTEVKPGITKEHVFREFKGDVYTMSSLDRKVVSYEYSPLRVISKPLPVKNIEFHVAHNNSSIWALLRDWSSPGYVTTFQPKLGSFDNSNTAALSATTSVTWSSCRGPAGEVLPTISSLMGDSSLVLASTPSGSCHDNLTQTPHKSNFTAPSNHSQPSYVTQWAPASRSTSTPYLGGPSRNDSHTLQVEEP
ncbi:hypothetical protein AWC38_SpisGene15396 [Stylophora pistillata]|uniref:Uncharacterized protein n=1 Tax=Stylophora pistillata TaxID=50429 RepID=A0A2B4RV67_STYPI|nr:hypothetical protein AWC38_SpisGene15396 [Stylophora pistillata]